MSEFFLQNWPWFALLVLTALTFIGLVWLGRRHNRVDWGNPLINWIDGINRLYCRKFHRLDCGQIELPVTGGVLLASNHVSGLDPLLLVAATRRPLRFMIATEQYHRFGFEWLFRATGCIPVDRKGRPDRAFRHAVKALQEGEVVALFPHGRIHLDSETSALIKPGLGRLSALSGCPVIPVRITGIRGQGSIFKALFLRARTRMTVFPKLPPAPFGDKAFHLHFGELLVGRRKSLEKRA